MRIERVISIFDIKDEKLLSEMDIDHIDLEILKSIFHPPSEDYLMYNPYSITKKEAEKLKSHVQITFDFSNKIYQLDCFQI